MASADRPCRKVVGHSVKADARSGDVVAAIVNFDVFGGGHHGCALQSHSTPPGFDPLDCCRHTGEDELAGMLAHAIAHVASRDVTQQATKTEFVNRASVPLIYMGAWTGYAMPEGQSPVPLGMLQMWRKYELDADRLAARKMATAGYDPAALARYIERVQAPDKMQPKMWSALPQRSQRVEAIRAVLGELPAQVYGPHEGLEKVQEEVRRLTASTPKPTRPNTTDPWPTKRRQRRGFSPIWLRTAGPASADRFPQPAAWCSSPAPAISAFTLSIPNRRAELWIAKLPASGHATPLTYLARNGWQYVAAAGWSGGYFSGPVSSALPALALP